MLIRSETRKRKKKKKKNQAQAANPLIRQGVQKRRERKAPLNHIDYQLFVVVLLLTAMGILSIGTASDHVAQAQFGNDLYYVKKQMMGATIGFVAMFFTLRIDFNRFPQYLKYMMVGTLFLLIATHIPGLGVTAKGSSRWINLGIRFQPSELAKPMIVIYLAIMLGQFKTQSLGFLKQLYVVWPVLAMMGVVLLQPDLGTTIVLASTVLLMYFSAGLPWRYLGIVVGGGFLAAVSWAISTPYQWDRIAYWWDPWSEPLGRGFHLIQSLIAIGSGGVFGKGFGQSVQKLFYLPEQHTDFIFAVISEEFGFIGVLSLLLLFVLVIQRGMSIACKVVDPTLKLMAIGLSSMVTLQAFINLAVVSGTIPTTGLTLPFISFGSSSLIVNLASMGLLLNISRYIPVKEKADELE